MRTIKLKDNNYWDTSSIMHNRMNLNELLNSIFPIGKVEIFYDSLDHSNYFGFNWERCSLERSPIGFNPSSSDNNYKTIGNKFGEKNHTLTLNELPNKINVPYGTAGTSGSTSALDGNSIYTVANLKGTVSLISGGNGTAHNTIHPVEVMAFWKRVS